MEADAFPILRGERGRFGDAAGGIRESRWHHLGNLRQRSHRPQWQGSPEYNDWLTWMKKYNASANTADNLNVYGYSCAQTMVGVLKASGDDLTRENVMKQAARIHNEKLPVVDDPRHVLPRNASHGG